MKWRSILSLSSLPVLHILCSFSCISFLYHYATKARQPKGMPGANTQILLTFLQDHTPKMCFPSLSMGLFIKMLSKIIPAGFWFFCCFFFLEFCSSHEEKVSWRSWHHAVLKIFLFPEGSATETTNSDCGEEEGEQWICSYTLLSHCSALLSSCCDIFVPRTPQVCIVFLCSLILPYPPFATLSHWILLPAGLCGELLLLFDRWTWKRKRQNIVVVVIWARIQVLRGIPLPNQWTNKQTNTLSLCLFFFLIFFAYFGWGKTFHSV